MVVGGGVGGGSCTGSTRNDSWGVFARQKWSDSRLRRFALAVGCQNEINVIVLPTCCNLVAGLCLGVFFLLLSLSLS